MVLLYLNALSTVQLYTVNFDVLFSGTEVDAFWDWWATLDLRVSEKFTGHLDVINDSNAVYQFLSVPQFNMVRAGNTATVLYKATFQLIQYSSSQPIQLVMPYKAAGYVSSELVLSYISQPPGLSFVSSELSVPYKSAIFVSQELGMVILI